MKRRLYALSVGILIPVLIVVCSEFVCALMLKNGRHFFETPTALGPGNFPLKLDKKFGLSPEMPPIIDEKLQPKSPGIPLQPDSTVKYENGRFILTSGNKVVVDVKNTNDPQGWRNTPGQENKKSDKFLLLIGDSQIYGQGVNDEETLASVFAKEFPKEKIYNRGILNVWPGELLDKMKSNGAENLKEKTGSAIYFFFPYHILRNMGAILPISGQGANKPYYYLDESGHVTKGRKFIEEMPASTRLKRLYGHSHIYQYFKLDFIPHEKDFRFHAEILKEMKEALKKKGAENFLVVLMPDQSNSFTREFIPYLEEAGIYFVDLSHWRSDLLVPGKTTVDYDGHYSGEYFKTIGAHLANVLKSEGLLSK